MKVLFIDDDEGRTRSLREALTLIEDVEVHCERTPHGGITAYSKDPKSWAVALIDIIIPHHDIAMFRDFSLPGCFTDNRTGLYTGLRVIRELADVREQSESSTAFIVLTVLRRDIDRCLQQMKLTPEAVLYKPPNLAEFLSTVSRYLAANR